MSSQLQLRFLGPFAICTEGVWHPDPPSTKTESVQYLAVYPHLAAYPRRVAAQSKKRRGPGRREGGLVSWLPLESGIEICSVREGTPHEAHDFRVGREPLSPS
jgi:hypothetical protein